MEESTLENKMAGKAHFHPIGFRFIEKLSNWSKLRKDVEQYNFRGVHQSLAYKTPT